MDYNYNAISNSFGQLSFIRVEFEVGYLSLEEEQNLNKIIAKSILDIDDESVSLNTLSSSNLQPITFSILYDEESDTKKIDRLFFKLKLQYPAFKILKGADRLSFYS